MRHVWVLILVAVGSVVAGQAWAGHSGGGHVTYYSVRVPGPAPVIGSLAGVVLDLEPSSPGDVTSGAFKPGDVIAQRRAKVHDAIVLKDTIKELGFEIAAGTVMFRVGTVPADPFNPTTAEGRVLWCSDRVLTALSQVRRIDCVETAGVNAPIWGVTNAQLIAGLDSPYAIAMVMESRRLEQRPSYEHVPSSQLPAVQIGYRVCADTADGVTKPWRFGVVAAPTLASGVQQFNCAFGDWPDLANKSKLKVDQLTLKVTSGVEGWRYEIEAPLKPGLLDPLIAGGGIGPAGAIVAQRRQEMRAALSQPTVRTTGPVTVTDQRVIAHGDALTAVPIAYNITGQLKYDVEFGGWPTKAHLKSGQPMFGAPTRSNIDNRIYITWCAPQSKDNSNKYNSMCFAPREGYYIWVGANSSLMPTHTNFTIGQEMIVNGFEVMESPVPPVSGMVLTWVFDHWTAPLRDQSKIAAQLGVEVRVNGQMNPIDHILVYANREGRYLFPILGGVIEFKPIATPPQIGDRTAIDRVDVSRAEVATVVPLRNNGDLPLRDAYLYDLPSTPVPRPARSFGGEFNVKPSDGLKLPPLNIDPSTQPGGATPPH